jgi:ATP-dependent helicase/nuclease subunit B
VSVQTIIAPASSLIQEVVSLLPADTNDFSDSIIVFPGKRPAHFTRKALADRIQGSVLPPRIFSIDSFIDYLVAEKLQIHRRPLQSFDALALLFEIHRDITARLGGEHFTTIDRFVALGSKLFGELEELVMADAKPSQIREALHLVPLARIYALPEYFERFYASVSQKDFTTRALNYRTAAENAPSIDLSSHKIIVMAGFYAYTRLERRIFENLVRRDNVSFIAQQGPGLRKQLMSIGVDPPPPADIGKEQSPTYRFYLSPDTHGQVFAVTEKIKELQDANQPVNERTVIVLPTPDGLFPIIHHTLPLLPEDGYNIALGYPLQRTPLFGFLNGLMEVCASARNGNVAASDYIAFALHPYTKNILFGQRADVTRMLFHAVETFLAENQSKMVVSLESLEEENKVFERVARQLAAAGDHVPLTELKSHLRTIHDCTLRKFLSFSSLRDFALKAIDVIQYIHKHSTATRHTYFRPYAERFLELFDAMSNSLLGQLDCPEPSAYAAFLRHAVSSEEAPFPGTPLKGLQVLGLLETRNLSFDTVFLLNATDDVIPGGRSHDVLLPQPLREKLGLETRRDREHLIEYYFSTLLAGAREVHCYYTESGNHEKSRFLEKLLWEQQKKSNQPDESGLVQLIHYNVQLSTPKPVAVEKTDAIAKFLRQFEFTATALDTYLACPLRFYYAHVLRLSQREEVAGEVELREIGTLVHKVLKAYFEQMVGKTLAATDLETSRMQSTIDRLFGSEFGTDLVGSAYLIKHQVSRQLESFLKGYQIPKASSEKIVLEGVETELSVNIGPYRFTGRIDRIEQRGERSVILDYKIGRNDQRIRINPGKLDPDDRSSWPDAIGSFQLLIYTLLYSSARDVPPESIVPAYLFLGRNEIGPDIEVPLGSGNYSAADVYHQVKPVMLRLIDEILDPSISFAPPERVEETCPGCPYTSICGTTWVGGNRL